MRRPSARDADGRRRDAASPADDLWQYDARLRREPPARVADLACGPGWSSIAIAQAYPLVSVEGFDLDADVIAAACPYVTPSGSTIRASSGRRAAQ